MECKNCIVYFKKFDNFHLIHLVVGTLEEFNFHQFFLLLSLITHSRARFDHVFFKNIHQKRKYYREEKQDFERFLIFLNIKMLANSNKIELSEEFIVMWREEQTLLDVMSPSQKNTCDRASFLMKLQASRNF